MFRSIYFLLSSFKSFKNEIRRDCVSIAGRIEHCRVYDSIIDFNFLIFSSSQSLNVSGLLQNKFHASLSIFTMLSEFCFSSFFGEMIENFPSFNPTKKVLPLLSSSLQDKRIDSRLSAPYSRQAAYFHLERIEVASSSNPNDSCRQTFYKQDTSQVFHGGA